MSARLQTKVYPYVLAKGGTQLTGAAIDPEKIEMRYWYVNRPELPEVFAYSKKQIQADEKTIQDLITEICSLGEIDDFPLTENPRHCRFCVYRSLCDRGEAAGELVEDDFEAATIEDFDLDFDTIEEIEF